VRNASLFIYFLVTIWIIQTPVTVAWQNCGEVLFTHAVCSQTGTLLLGIEEFTK